MKGQRTKIGKRTKHSSKSKNGSRSKLGQRKKNRNSRFYKHLESISNSRLVEQVKKHKVKLLVITSVVTAGTIAVLLLNRKTNKVEAETEIPEEEFESFIDSYNNSSLNDIIIVRQTNNNKPKNQESQSNESSSTETVTETVTTPTPPPATLTVGDNPYYFATQDYWIWNTGQGFSANDAKEFYESVGLPYSYYSSEGLQWVYQWTVNN